MVNLSRGTCILPAALHSGSSFRQQTSVSVLARGCDILVGTPHCVRGMLSGGNIAGVKALSLECLSHMIWDEADDLLSKPFAKDIDDILGMRSMPKDSHHWFLSTQYDKEHIAKAKSIMAYRHPHVVFNLPDERAAIRYRSIEQRFVGTGEDKTERFSTLKGILCNDDVTKTIIVCQTPASIEWLHNAFTSINIPFCSTHETYSQERRENALHSFKNDFVRVLVGTMGIVGRGLNFQGVDCVIFWELPESTDQYRWCLNRVRR